MKIVRVSLAIALLALGLVSRAQPAAKDQEKGRDAEDASWAVLVEDFNRGQTVEGVVERADRFKDFADKNPGHPKRKEAKAREAVLLARAAFLGDQATAPRLQVVRGQVKADKDVDAALRAELKATVDSTEILRARHTDRDVELAAYEASSRGLVDEFPELAIGYESLLGIAIDSNERRAAAIARELLAMDGAPAAVKAGAEVLLARLSLVGTAVPPSLVRLADGGGSIVVYAWSSHDQGSQRRAKAVAEAANPAVSFIGICLDDNAAASMDGLPGRQSADLDLARQLKLDTPGLIYGVGANGILRSVSLHRDLGASFLRTQP